MAIKIMKRTVGFFSSWMWLLTVFLRNLFDVTLSLHSCSHRLMRLSAAHFSLSRSRSVNVWRSKWKLLLLLTFKRLRSLSSLLKRPKLLCTAFLLFQFIHSILFRISFFSFYISIFAFFTSFFFLLKWKNLKNGTHFISVVHSGEKKCLKINYNIKWVGKTTQFVFSLYANSISFHFFLLLLLL